MKKTFIVLGCNPSNEGKTFVWKLAVESKVSVFGVEKTVKRTYYIGGMPEQAEKGATFQENMDKFEIVERPFEVVDEQTGETTTVMLKWLHAKV